MHLGLNGFRPSAVTCGGWTGQLSLRVRSMPTAHCLLPAPLEGDATNADEERRDTIALMRSELSYAPFGATCVADAVWDG